MFEPSPLLCVCVCNTSRLRGESAKGMLKSAENSAMKPALNENCACIFFRAVKYVTFHAVKDGVVFFYDLRKCYLKSLKILSWVGP